MSSLGSPKSFADRGCLVGFMKPSILQARLRARADGNMIEWEILIPMNRDKRNNSVMIMPWRQLTAFTSLDIRDHQLYKAIDRIDDDNPDPLTIRLARLATDADYHPDPEKKAEAREALSREHRDRQGVYFSLLAQMTRQTGVALGDTFMARADTKLLMKITQGDGDTGIDSESLTNRVLGFQAQKVGITVKDVNSRLEAVTDQAAVFGSLNVAEGASRDGLFSHMKQQMVDFELSLEHFESNSGPEVENMSMMIRFAAKDFVKYIEEKTAAVEQIMSNFATVLTEADRVLSIVKKARREVAYALDGWDSLCRLWFDLKEDASYPERIEVLTIIFNHLPLMPEGEIETNSERSKVWKGFNAARVSVVRAMVSWTDNEVDRELEDRINRAKEASRQRESTLNESGGRRRR